MYIFACISAHITEIFFKIHIWDTGHIHYECYKFGCARSIGKGTLCDDLCMCSSVSWLPIGGIVLKSHTTCVLHFSTGIEGLASSCVCLISSNRLDKRLGGYKNQKGCGQRKKSHPCPKSKHGYPARTQSVYDNSSPKMKLTFVPQYCYSSKASNINIKPEKHISSICLEQ